MKRLYTAALRGKKQSTESDLTGNYKTAFNKGKQAETEMRVRHNHIYR